MVSKIYSATLTGILPRLVEVETSCTPGLRTFSVVGLPNESIKEAKERIGVAIKSINLSPPFKEALRVLINLIPADFKKEGTCFDLPIALGFLLASKQTKFDSSSKLIVGELGLDGALKPIKGALSFACLAKEFGFKEIILPKENAAEAALLNYKNSSSFKITGLTNLKEVIFYLEGKINVENFILDSEKIFKTKLNFEIDFSWIKGQEYAKRALEIAAAGAHNMLMFGPPGAGKTLLAKSMTSILPKLELEEILELTKIYSAANLLAEKEILNQRPFRTPHHASSEIALLGGGNPFKIGEITLAHRGILFLDELPEFHRDVLESLRQPMEEGKITISRSKYSFTLPAQFSLVAAANPCPCGYLNEPEKECICTNSQIAGYKRKLSGPMIDRIDIFIEVPSLKYEKLISTEEQNLFEKIKERVTLARKIQKERFKKDSSALLSLTNSEMKIPQIKKYCQINEKASVLLKKYVDSGKLTARGFHRVLKVSRTIADLAGEKDISFENVAEALMYRSKER